MRAPPIFARPYTTFQGAIGLRLAVLVPAAVYGLCHTNFEFLPPADPWWFRPLLLAGVGSIWGWAFFRFDALTVVLSHLTCDLFIFNWPLMHLGGWNAVEAMLVILVPLMPAAIGLALQMQMQMQMQSRGARPVRR